MFINPLLIEFYFTRIEGISIYGMRQYTLMIIFFLFTNSSYLIHLVQQPTTQKLSRQSEKYTIIL